MRRRDFIGALALLPIAGSASAQRSAGVKRMAFAVPSGPVTDMKIGGDTYFTVFLQELQRLGFIEGQNLTIERYSAEGVKERHSDLAREVVGTQPDLISTSGTPLTRAFMSTTTTIPIVTITGDPIRQRLVPNIAHPGGNVTGVSVDAGFELWGKRLELLAEALPKTRTVVLVSTAAAAGGDPWNFPGPKAIRQTAQRLGISLISVQVSFPINEQTLKNAFATITPGLADGIMFATEVEFYTHRLLIVDLVRQVGIPAIYALREQAEAGGLMAYSDDINQAFRLQAQQVSEVLRGRKPADMPYLQATKYELVINLKTAKAFGLELSATLVARADAVIE